MKTFHIQKNKKSREARIFESKYVRSLLSKRISVNLNITKKYHLLIISKRLQKNIFVVFKCKWSVHYTC